MNKRTQKAGFRFHWKRRPLNNAEYKVKRDLGLVKNTHTYDKTNLDNTFLELCNKKKEQLNLDDTTKSGILYEACKYDNQNFDYQNKKKINIHTVKARNKINNNRIKINNQTRKLLANYHLNIGQKPKQPRNIFGKLFNRFRKSKKKTATSQQIYNGF